MHAVPATRGHLRTAQQSTATQAPNSGGKFRSSGHVWLLAGNLVHTGNLSRPVCATPVPWPRLYGARVQAQAVLHPAGCSFIPTAVRIKLEAGTCTSAT